MGDSKQVGVYTSELDKEEEGHIMIEFGFASVCHHPHACIYLKVILSGLVFWEELQ